ncbi:MAG: glycosyltransferase [Ignavibacteria bacterium]|nr:MAG: glycosyltransferase [Ignavibacteria bacterium]
MLADPSSPHTIKWANGLHEKGLDISIFGISSYDRTQYKSGIKIDIFAIPQFIKLQTNGSLLKVSYLLALPSLKKKIRSLKPDIIHAHSASSYSLLGALSGFHPFAISVWGKDVYNFPQKSSFLKKVIIFNLKKSDMLFSTSKIMAEETKKYTNKKIHVVPFGIDIEKFKPKKTDGYFSENDIVIGTIKSIEKKYGTDNLVRAFKKVKEKHPDLPLKLLIVGGGSMIIYIKSLVNDLGIESDVKITGLVGYDKIPEYHRMLDIYIAVSTEDSESFGVAILEASACETPVIVSNVGGLPEVVDNNVTGFIISHSNVELLVEKIELLLDENLRKKLGKAGRTKVKKKFNLQDNIEDMANNYKSILKNYFL